MCRLEGTIIDMWSRSKRRVAWFGFLLVAWLHLTGFSTFEGSDAENQPSENNPEESFRKGIAFYKEKRYEEAIAHLETSLRTPTEWEEYPYFYLLESHWKAEHVAEALGFCKVFQQRFPKSPLIDRVAYIEAQGYQKSSAYWLASRAYEAYLEKKDFAEVRLRYGESLEQLERFSDAYGNYQRIREKWPLSLEARKAKHRAREIIEEHPESIASVPRASYLREEARLCLREQAYTEALTFYEELQGLPMSRAERERLLLNQIVAHAGRGDLQAADAVLRSLIQQYPKSEAIPEGLLVVGRGYWRRDRNQEALPVLTKLVEEYTDAEEAGRAGFILGRIHFEAGHLKKAIRQYRETRFLFPDTSWEEEAAWGEAWCYYLLGKYEACAEHLRECVSEEVWDLSIPRALYWQARCLERAGRLGESRVVYERTRNGYPDSYYSILAEWRLTGKALKEIIAPRAEGVGAQANEPEEPKVFEKLADPALPLLVETGLMKDAVARLDWLRKGAQDEGMTQEDWVETYCLAGNYLKALRMSWQEGLLSPRLEEGIYGRDPDAKRFLRLLYPLPARFDIQEKARQRGLDPFLVAGLIHQESVFMDDAVSPAGAIGLMQIMPATGKRVAEKIGLEGFTASSLQDPEVNVTIGTAYLEGLASRYEEDWPKVFAAYNAGPGAVARWTALMPFAETDEFVESIRYLETRIYVKKVLFNWALYHRIYTGCCPDPAGEEHDLDSSPYRFDR
jgi:soluble lytic murein transglycosylase